MNRLISACGLLFVAALAGCADRSGTDAKASAGAVATPAGAGKPAQPVSNGDKPMTQQTAMFGAGCFWGVEATFRKIEGVSETQVGFAGGDLANPSYAQVCREDTGHAEVVNLTFDPAKVSYRRLVEYFFKLHDPTQVNRQGPDVGDQYRSVIFYYTPEQKATAEAIKQELAAGGKYKKPIATKIEPAPAFYRAEEYHQRYLEKNGLDNCHVPQ